MSEDSVNQESYGGFEQGPIRPPSEARSLLIRVTRNCPWNRCTFCPVYKGTRFSIRSVDHVKRDIDLVHRYVERLINSVGGTDRVLRHEARERVTADTCEEDRALVAAYNWLYSGRMKAVFLQDANSLVVKPPRLVEILGHLRERFPSVERVTSYARSQTVARISDGDMKALAEAGLNRIHIGLESGSDRVLERVKKGVTKEAAVQAGRKVKAAGIELSEYYMPGLGGRSLSWEHATESADALNQINPDFIRLRTLAIPSHVPLFGECCEGRFVRATDLEIIEETILFLERLDGISSVVKSDHILNLFEDVEGTLPRDKERMIGLLRRFVEMDRREQCFYQVGRRLGVFARLADMESPKAMAMVEGVCKEHGITPDNVDELIYTLMARFI